MGFTHISKLLDVNIQRLIAENVRTDERLKFQAIYESKKKEFKKLDVKSLKVQMEDAQWLK